MYLPKKTSFKSFGKIKCDTSWEIFITIVFHAVVVYNDSFVLECKALFSIGEAASLPCVQNCREEDRLEGLHRLLDVGLCHGVERRGSLTVSHASTEKGCNSTRSGQLYVKFACKPFHACGEFRNVLI